MASTAHSILKGGVEPVRCDYRYAVAEPEPGVSDICDTCSLQNLVTNRHPAVDGAAVAR